MASTKRKVSELDMDEPSYTSSPTIKKQKPELKVQENKEQDDDEIFEIKCEENLTSGKRSLPRSKRVLKDKNNNSVDTNNPTTSKSEEEEVEEEDEYQPKSSKKSSKSKENRAKAKKLFDQPKCAMCGRDDKLALKETKKLLTITPCCQYWICDDEHTYLNPRFNDIFSSVFKLYDSCSREHKRYSMCHFHWLEGHSTTISCDECKECLRVCDGAQGEIVYEQNKADLKCQNCLMNITGPDQIYGTAYDRSSKKYYRYCKKNECQMFVTKKKK